MNESQQQLFGALNRAIDAIIDYTELKNSYGGIDQNMTHEGDRARKALRKKIEKMRYVQKTYLTHALEDHYTYSITNRNIKDVVGILSDTFVDALNGYASWTTLSKWCVKELKKLKVDTIEELPEIMQVMDTVAKQWKIK